MKIAQWKFVHTMSLEKINFYANSCWNSHAKSRVTVIVSFRIE